MERITNLVAFLLFSGGCIFAQQQYKVLWNFGTSPGDGAFPVASLVFDPAGNLYGTTRAGGTFLQGSVFELSPNTDGTWNETVLYSFCPNFPQLCIDGQSPQAGLLLDSEGNLYGTTYSGGNSESCGNGPGCGVVFELSPASAPGGTWTEAVLDNFCSNFVNHQCLDGFFPKSQLIRGASGTIYGTTSAGGSGHFGGGGTVFKLSRSNGGWTESVLYSFCSLGQEEACPDGNSPQAGVTLDKLGNLYGTTELGGTAHSQGAGIVYKLSPNQNGWTEKVLSDAGSQGQNGGGPLGTVSIDALGNLYSTASIGGSTGNGTVFRLGAKGGVTVVSFEGPNGGLPAAGVLLDAKRNTLYGTTEGGGGSGNVYQIIPPAQITSLYSFCSQQNCVDGSWPTASLVEDQSGNLYGTTKSGGTGISCQGGCGVVFEIIPSPSAQGHDTKGPLVWRTLLPTQKK
jgi:uncharacterized repeat protein (TIGR03803 family)